MVVELITEVEDVFCDDEESISDIPECKMKKNLKDKTPVQKNYYSILNPLDQEVRTDVDDLLNKSWITKSWSSYSPPVVAVCKDKMLKLCCNYAVLNKKTVVT